MTDQKESPRIGLYGGSFNPPHMAHVLVIAWALATGELDEVWVIPTGGHPFGKPLAPWQDRIEMCWRAFECFGERISLLDIEQEPRVHYSIDTVRILRQQAPVVRWRWVMGSDTLEEAERWKDWDELIKLAPPLIIPRKGRGGVAEDVFALPPISATLIREAIAKQDFAAAQMLLPNPVLEYIKEKGLYREGQSETEQKVSP